MNIDTDEDFPEHPKTVRFCAMLGNPIGWAYLWKLWRWCKKFQPNGDLTGFTPAEIELHVGWVAMDGKFFEAAVKSGFIDRDETGTRIHNWGRRLGGSLLRMELDRVRKALARATRDNDTREAERLAALMASLRERLSAEGSRTSDGHPSDKPRTNQVGPPNGAGLPPPVQALATVSDLICSDLICSDPDLSPSARARDPGPEPVVPAPPQPPAGATVHPLPLPSPPDPDRITAHELLQRFGIRWREKHAMPWAPDRNASRAARDLLEDQIGRMEPEARKAAFADLLPAIERYLADEGKDGSLLAAKHPFGWFVDRFNRYRAEPEGASAPKKKHWMDDLKFMDPDAAPR